MTVHETSSSVHSRQSVHPDATRPAALQMGGICASQVASG